MHRSSCLQEWSAGHADGQNAGSMDCRWLLSRRYIRLIGEGRTHPGLCRSTSYQQHRQFLPIKKAKHSVAFRLDDFPRIIQQMLGFLYFLEASGALSIVAVNQRQVWVGFQVCDDQPAGRRQHPPELSDKKRWVLQIADD